MPNNSNFPEPIDASFATIAGIHSDGVSLIFDGETTARTKHYKVNKAITFSLLDRVHLVKESGTYIVEYPVGNPKR